MSASYLFAWVFWLCLSLGCLGVLLLHHLFRAAWGRAVMPALEAGVRTLPLMAALILPILVWGMPELYPWASGGHDEAIHEHRALYMNMPFFLARSVFYFAVWIGLGTYLTRSTLRERRSGDRSLEQRRTNVSAPGMVVFVLTVTFAVTDWVMSTEAHWFSTIYGVWFITGQGLAAVALAAWWWRGRHSAGGVEEDADFPVSRDLGNLLLAFTLFWAYISLSQYLIIWSANLPEETTFYLRRSGSGWQALGAALIVGQFVVPFLALLSGKTKRSPRMLGLVAGWTLAFRVCDVYWIVMPSARAGSAAPTLADALAFVGIGIAWCAVYMVGLRNLAPYRCGDDGQASGAVSHA
ncbi:MAG: hypothetical protein FJX72_03420 [Armatimonadetes bacterium]|nr:hypothetical protein [Armatimonadota bacterium]